MYIHVVYMYIEVCWECYDHTC